jgi:ubiquitin-protein ligase E3 A
VRRDEIVHDAIHGIEQQNPANFLKKLFVVFEGEEAVDAGGPSREFLYLLTDKMLSPDYGMFRIVEDKYFWFVPRSFEEAHSFLLVGAVLGLAVHNSVVLPIRFPLCLYKKLLNPRQKFYISDLMEIDSATGRSLFEMERMVLRGDDVSSCYLNFTVTVEEFGRPTVYELCEGGSERDVTNENLAEYIDSYVDFVLCTSVEANFRAFYQGFKLSIQAPSYMLLDPSELDVLVSGEEDLDWESFKSKVAYDGYTKTDEVIKWFWEVFDDFSEGQKKKFLKFSTGSDRAPFGGLGHVEVTIEKEQYRGQLPLSHTCFFRFSLPEYGTKNELKEKMTMAIEESEGFGFV